MANTFSGFLVTSKNIYLNNSLNYNLNQVNKILSSLITEDTNKDVRDVMNYFFEKNKPAAFSNPIYAKLSDWLMFKDILLGRLKIW